MGGTCRCFAHMSHVHVHACADSASAPPRQLTSALPRPYLGDQLDDLDAGRLVHAHVHKLHHAQVERLATINQPSGRCHNGQGGESGGRAARRAARGLSVAAGGWSRKLRSDQNGFRAPPPPPPPPALRTVPMKGQCPHTLEARPTIETLRNPTHLAHERAEGSAVSLGKVLRGRYAQVSRHTVLDHREFKPAAWNVCLVCSRALGAALLCCAALMRSAPVAAHNSCSRSHDCLLLPVQTNSFGAGEGGVKTPRGRDVPAAESVSCGPQCARSRRKVASP